MAVRRSYGGLWQECRALVATALFSWAFRAHSEATFDLAASLAAVRRGGA